MVFYGRLSAEKLVVESVLYDITILFGSFEKAYFSFYLQTATINLWDNEMIIGLARVFLNVLVQPT